MEEEDAIHTDSLDMMSTQKDLNTNDLDLDSESPAASQVICAISCAVI